MMMSGRCAPHFLFETSKRKCAAPGGKENMFGGSVCAGADLLPPAGGWLTVLCGSQGRKRATLGETTSPGKSGIHPAPLFAAALLAVRESPELFTVGAVINRPGDSAGVPAGQCAPHSLFGCAKKRTRRARCKRKRRRARSGAVALRAYGGRRTSACSDLALPSGTLCSSAISPTAVPWRMVRKLSGCKNAFDQLLFPRVPLRYALPGRL